MKGAISILLSRIVLVLLAGVTVLLAQQGPIIQNKANAAQKSAAPASDTTSQRQTTQGYRIDQPGTITFTVGVKIKGKVEKPEVMIFLPKERSLYRDVKFNRSFSEDLADPLPFTPILK